MLPHNFKNEDFKPLDFNPPNFQEYNCPRSVSQALTVWSYLFNPSSNQGIYETSPSLSGRLNRSQTTTSSSLDLGRTQPSEEDFFCCFLRIGLKTIQEWGVQLRMNKKTEDFPVISISCVPRACPVKSTPFAVHIHVFLEQIVVLRVRITSRRVATQSVICPGDEP